MRTELIVTVDSNFKSVDLYDDVSIPLTFQVSDIKDITKKNTNYSKTFEVPCTEDNMLLFENTSIAGISGIEMSKRYDCKILQDSQEVFTGVVSVVKVNKENNTPISYTIQVNSRVKTFIDRINNLTFSDINWNDMKVDVNNMSPYYTRTTLYNKDWDTQFSDGIGIALIDRVNNIGNNIDRWRSKDLSPFVYTNKILDKIITGAGYKWDSRFFRHHYYGDWDDFNEWIKSTSSGIPDKEIQNVSKYESRQFVIPSQVDPNNFEWDKILPGSVCNDTYIGRRITSSETSPSDQQWQIKSLNIKPTLSSYPPADVFSNISYNFFSTDSDLNTNYKLSKVNVNGSVDETGGMQNFCFVAPAPGWYDLSFNFDWKFMVGGFWRVDYDSSVTPHIPYWRSITALIDPGEYLAQNRKLKIEDKDEQIYGVYFNIKVTDNNDNNAIYFPLYQVESTGNGLMYDLDRRYGTGGKKIRLVEAPDGLGGILINESTEYEEYNEPYESTVTTVNGWEFGRPVNKSHLVYLYAGDKVYLHAVADFYNGQMDDESSNLFDCNIKHGSNYYCCSKNWLWISSRPDEKLFDAKLVDKIGPYRGLNPELFFDNTTKQVDFFTSIAKMFNLYIEDVSGKKIVDTDNNISKFYPENTLLIEPRPIYYNIGTNEYNAYDITQKYAKKIVDFTDYVDFSSISYSRPNDYLYRNLIFKMKDDSSDYFSKLYKEKTLKEIGEYTKKSFYESTEDSDKIDMIFSNTTNGNSACKEGDSRTASIPLIFSINDKGEVNTGYTSSMRFLQKYSQSNNTPKVFYDSTNYFATGTTPILSVFNDIVQIDNAFGRSRLEFGARDYYLETLSERSTFKIPNSDLFNVFYLNEYEQITNEDARVLKCKCYIPANVIANLKLSHNILIDGITYYINSISNWTSEYEPCDCEFLKVNTYSYYNYYIDNPTPNGFTIQFIGATSSNNSSGNTTVNSTSNNYTVINQTSIGTTDNYTLGGLNGNVALYKNGVTQSQVTIPTFHGGNRGLVPDSDSENNKFLCADGSWKVCSTSGSYTLDSIDGISVSLYRDNQLVDRVPLDTFDGADAYNAGTPGLVPTAQIADRTKFLRGDGTWAAGAGSGGSTYTIQNNFQTPTEIELLENGVVTSSANVPEYEGCNATLSGEYGVLKPAAAGQMDYYFAGDGTWKPINNVYVFRFTLHAGDYTLNYGNYNDAITALHAGKPVFAIVIDEDSSQNGDTGIWQATAHSDTDTTIYFSRMYTFDSFDKLEIYDDNTFNFTIVLHRNFGRLKVDNNTTYQSTNQNSVITLNSGTGTQLAQSGASVTVNMKTASNTEIGGVKVSASQAANAGTLSASGVRRPVQVDANGNASVRVNEYTLPTASSTAIGGIKVSSTQASNISTIADRGTVRPVQIDNSGVACVKVADAEKAADIGRGTYRDGLSFLDYDSVGYKDRAGTVTPLMAIETSDEYGEDALDAWRKIDGLYEVVGGQIHAMAPKNGRFYALPVITIKTSDGSVPVVLVNEEIAGKLTDDGYTLNKTPLVSAPQ